MIGALAAVPISTDVVARLLQRPSSSFPLCVLQQGTIERDYAIRNGRCSVMLPNEKEPWLIDKCAKWKSWTELPLWFWRNFKGGVQPGPKIVSQFWIIPKLKSGKMTTSSQQLFPPSLFLTLLCFGNCSGHRQSFLTPFLLASMDFWNRRQTQLLPTARDNLSLFFLWFSATSTNVVIQSSISNTKRQDRQNATQPPTTS